MKTVDEFILSLPKEESVIISRLRQLIFEADPRFTERLAYEFPTSTVIVAFVFFGPPLPRWVLKIV